MDRLRAAPFHHGNLEVLENGPSGVISFPLCFVNLRRRGRYDAAAVL
jgi:hypothetical protein